MQRQDYDWLFIFAVVIVLVAFIATSLQSLSGDTSPVLAIITAIGGLLTNIAASRFEQKVQVPSDGRAHAWLIGGITAAALYVIFNAVTYVVAFALESEQSQLVLRQVQFVDNETNFEMFVALSASSVAALSMTIVCVIAGASLITRSRNHFVSTLVGAIGFLAIGVLIRFASLVQGDISQFKMFSRVGWVDVFLGLLLNLSIDSSMLWLGVVLMRGRRIPGGK